MAKKLRSIIITLCVGVVALSAYFIVDAVMAKQESNKTTTTVLTSYAASEIASLKVTLQSGEYYFITENAAESTSSYIVPYKVTFNGVYEGIEYDSSRANSLMSAACNLSASRDLGKMDESEYAFDSELTISKV